MPYLRKIDLAIESARKLARIGASQNLVNLLRKLRPADVAVILHSLTDRDRIFTVDVLLKQNEDFVIQAISEMPPEEGAGLLAHLTPDRIAWLLQKIPTDDATELASKLPPETFEQVISRMSVDQSADVVDQLQFEESTAGRIMTPDVFALHEDLSVSEAIATLQRKSDELEMVFYVYVVDDRHRLVGVVNLRQLLLNPPSTPLKKIMTADVISVSTDTDQEEVAEIVSKYNLMAIPVVDEEHRLVGMVTIDDVVDVLREEATEDIYALAGVSTEERVNTPAFRSLRLRIPWLYANLATALLASFVVHIFEPTVAKVVALATLMPMVAGMGGNGAIQTITVIVRGMALNELSWANTRWVLTKEILVGIGNGIAFGITAAAIAQWWFGRPLLGLVVGVAMVLNMLVAGLAGTLIPLILKWAGADPAIAAGVIVTTFTDVCGFLALLGFASLVIQRLV